MADNVQLNIPDTAGATIATDDISGIQHQLVKVEFGADGAATQVSAAAPLPVVQTGTPALPTGAATSDNQQTDALTDAELRATPVPVSGTFYQATQPVSGTVAVSSLPAGLAIAANQQTDALTDAQLRASAVPVSAAALPLPSGASIATKQDEQSALLTTLNNLIETNNALVQLLAPLAGAMNSGAPALMVKPIASVSTAVTGTLTAVTTVGTITNFGTAIPAKEMADDINNFTVTLANINNVTA